MIPAVLISQIQKALQKEPRILAAYVIGSQVSQKTRPESDFDLAIVVGDKKLLNEDKIYELVRHLNFPKDLDLSVVDRSSSPLFLFQIISRGQRIYSSNPSKVASFEAFVLHYYYDTQHLRDIYYQGLKHKFTS
ncbi:MAG: nucleotidyltransferase domain-containing protein [bacterium]|nr:nucleotidyltransferase domain-containing protein [bacterium]